MMPLRIEVEGFAAFRERAVVDFEGVDLFALVGPTGAGKSSVIDAMVFALYGSVPRYGSENLVHPVITQGALEARVRLDFSLDGHAYVATRVVRRTKTGATTKEARLECGDEVLADDAKGLTAAVIDLLGLDLEQFTKCVVLPQGDFARLLHDTKSSRQDLLVKLLGLGLYEQVATGARAEARAAGQRIELLDDHLARSADVTDEAVAVAADRVRVLDALVATIDDAAPRLTELDDRLRQAEAAATEHQQAIVTLQSLDAPVDVVAVSHRAAEALEAVASAERVELAATTRLQEVRGERAALTSEAELRQTQADRDRLADLDRRLERGRALLEEAEAESSRTASALEAARDADRAAAETLDAARVRHAAVELARHLHVGDDCPVCGNTVATLPERDDSALAAVEVQRADAAAALREATTAATTLEAKLSGYRDTLHERAEERDGVAARLAGAPSSDEITRQLEALTAITEAIEAAEAAERDARAQVRAARSDADAAAQRVDEARRSFSAARDAVARLGPPPLSGDLEADWKELTQWADGAIDDRRHALEQAAETRRGIAAERTAAVDDLRSRAAAVGVTATEHGVRDAVVAATERARTEHERLTRELDAVVALRAERAALDERRQVHELLAEQLGARGFESWLLDEVLDVLLDGATTWLEQLSSGRYAMAVDDKKQFVVIDHANADEQRLARTLSGGETFLASLALALALAERVGELSATGRAPLDAIFLDEGFGTLDPDTLDVVATAIEELGATGRMVGVISHVAELAERVPVRYEITKTPGTSVVRKVDA